MGEWWEGDRISDGARRQVDGLVMNHSFIAYYWPVWMHEASALQLDVLDTVTQ